MEPTHQRSCRLVGRKLTTLAGTEVTARRSLLMSPWLEQGGRGRQRSLSHRGWHSDDAPPAWRPQVSMSPLPLELPLRARASHVASQCGCHATQKTSACLVQESGAHRSTQEGEAKGLRLGDPRLPGNPAPCPPSQACVAPCAREPRIHPLVLTTRG